MLRGPYGNAARTDFEDHPVAPFRTYTRAIKRRTATFPQQTSSGSVWQAPEIIQSPAILRMRSRPVITPAANVEKLELWYAPAPAPPTIGDGILAAGAAAYFATPGEWYWQVTSPFVATCQLDAQLLDTPSDLAAFLDYDKPQACQYTVQSITVNSGADKGILMANAQVEARRISIMKTSTGTNIAWINLGDVATATNAVARLVNQGDTYVLEARALPMYSIHVFNAGLSNDTFALAVWT
jgi:hypothetical protein